MRISGVTVGKVKDLELPEDGNATRAVMEIELEFAPISSDAQAIPLKTLLGETYVSELARQPGGPGDEARPSRRRRRSVDVGGLSGGDAAEPIPEAAPGGSGRRSQVQIDEIFNGFDEATRASRSG